MLTRNETRPAYGYSPIDVMTHSFIGGAPYMLPNETSLPKDKDGNTYVFFGQFDLSQVPELEFDLPSSGILQIFTGKDDLFGMSFDNYADPSEGTKTLFRIVSGNLNKEFELPKTYLDDVTPDVTPLSTPFERTYLTGELVSMEPLMGSLESGENSETSTSGYCFHLGGFPAFTQEDFRDDLETSHLIAGSDSVDGVVWGDMGVASWWVHSDNMDSVFTPDVLDDVFIHWDCY